MFAATSEGKPQLWVRTLDAVSARPLPGTDDAARPFWSPDSRSVGFSANFSSSASTSTADRSRLSAGGSTGGSAWNQEDTILFSNYPDGSLQTHLRQRRRADRGAEAQSPIECLPVSSVPARRPPFSVSRARHGAGHLHRPAWSIRATQTRSSKRWQPRTPRPGIFCSCARARCSLRPSMSNGYSSSAT